MPYAPMLCFVMLCYVILCYVLNILAHTPHLTGQNVEHRLVRKPSTKVQVWLVLLYLLAPIMSEIKGRGASIFCCEMDTINISL